MSEKIQPRRLHLNSLDEIATEVQSLLAGPYELAGNWNLAQICNHCRLWMTFPMDGYPRPPFPFGIIFGLMRITVGKRQLRQVLQNGFKPGTPTIPSTVPAADGTFDQAAAEELLKTVQRFQEHPGPLHPSPLFGKLDRDTHLKLQLAHASHHLGFLIPVKD